MFALIRLILSAPSRNQSCSYQGPQPTVRAEVDAYSTYLDKHGEDLDFAAEEGTPSTFGSVCAVAA